MSSRKRSAKARQVEQFTSQFADMDTLFSREQKRNEATQRAHDSALERKACTSKKRYGSKAAAETAIYSCAEHGTTGLRCYKCPYCDGWHLTSKPQD